MRGSLLVVVLALCPLALASSAAFKISRPDWLNPGDVMPKGKISENKVIFYGTGEYTNALRTINPFLKASDLTGIPNGAACATRKPWETCEQYLSLFSGLAVYDKSGGNGFTFLGITDRGPNVDCADFEDLAEDNPGSEWETAVNSIINKTSLDNGQTFPAPKFAPSFFKVKYDTRTNKLALGESCFLKNLKGMPINGLSNVAGRDPVPWTGVCNAGPVGYSQAGLDTEDIQVIPGRNLVAIVDEYTPSIAIALGFGDDSNDWEEDYKSWGGYGFKGKKACGQILARYVPEDSTLTSKEAGYPIIKALPALFTYRRGNRGMENLAISADGKTLIAMLQSPMVPLASSRGTRASPFLTAVRMDITNVMKPKVLGVHLYVEDIAESATKTAWADDEERQRDIKASGFADAAPVLGLKAGTPVVLVIERALSQVKIYMADFSKATNVLPQMAANPLVFDRLADDLKGYDNALAEIAKMGVVPAKKALVLDTGLITAGAASALPGWKGSDKQEGVAILNKYAIALGADNDFGFLAQQSSLSVVHLAESLDKTYKKMWA